MELKQGSVLFARIDSPIEGKEVSQETIGECMAYLDTLSKERYFLAGTFGNANGAMILFEAKDIDEAQKISDADPIIKSGCYEYKLYEWHLHVLS